MKKISVDSVTKLQALQEAVALWEWLAKTGSGHKEQWPGWKHWDRHPHNNCPLCAYSINMTPYCRLKSNFYCRDCPVEWIGGQGKVYSRGYYCVCSGSPYLPWELAIYDEDFAPGEAKIIRLRESRKVLALLRKMLQIVEEGEGEGES